QRPSRVEGRYPGHVREALDCQSGWRYLVSGRRRVEAEIGTRSLGRATLGMSMTCGDGPVHAGRGPVHTGIRRARRTYMVRQAPERAVPYSRTPIPLLSIVSAAVNS